MIFARLRTSQVMLSAALVLMMPAQPANCADLDEEGGGTASGWSFRFTTYSWASWLTGEGGVAGRGFDIEMDPIQLIEHLDWDQIPVWMSYAEARYGRLSLFNDVIYSRLEGSGDFATNVGRRRVSLALGADVEADVVQVMVEGGGAYEVAKWASPRVSSFTALDLLAGARYWYQEVDLSVDVSATLNILGLALSGNRAIARSGSVDWVDPFVGARVRHQLAPGEEIVVRGDVGGFDVGSKFSWQVIGTYSWQMCTLNGLMVDGYVGYRALSVDYEQGSGLKEYEYDVIQHGPVVGMTTRF